MSEYHVDMQDWQRWPKALIMRRVWSTNGHNRHREVRRYVPDGYAKEVEAENATLQHMAEYCMDYARDEILKARNNENRERASADRLRDRVHEISADRDRLKAENEKLREYAHSLEVANIDMASRLEDYIGQYDPTDAFVAEVRAKNEKLREFASRLVEYVDPASHQDACNIACPAYARCYGKSTCAFPDWAIERVKELGIEVEE